jgi:Ran GTPase-activating protein (RanGAP) involved in mRNA processing and transport
LLDLSKNNLGNQGVAMLMPGLRMNRSLVSLDLGSNDITNEGAALLFDVVRYHKSLSALTIANHDRFHRNRIGLNACNNLHNMLRDN